MRSVRTALAAAAVVVLGGVGACGGPTANRAGRASATTPARADGPVSPIDTEDELTARRAEYEGLAVDDPSRPARRAAMTAFLLKQVDRALAGNHLDDAIAPLRQALSLWDPTELKPGLVEPKLLDAALRVERAFRRRGAHEEVTLALAAAISFGDDKSAAAARSRFTEMEGWLRGADASGEGGADGREKLIDDLEAAARVFPSPFVVERLTALYLERAADFGPEGGSGGGGLSLRRGGRRAPSLADLLARNQRQSLTLELARLYLRVSRPESLFSLYKKIEGSPAEDTKLRAIVEKAFAPTATAEDAVKLAVAFSRESGREADRDVGLRICRDAMRRFPKAVEPRLCAGEFAVETGQLGLARAVFESALALAPDQKEVWDQLGRLYLVRLAQIVSDENIDVREMERQIQRVESFHTDAEKRFGPKGLKTSMTAVLYEVGRGYYNAGRPDQSMRYLERALAAEPNLPSLELLGQIRLKRNDARAAAALFEKAIALPQEDENVRRYFRAKLRRHLAEALDQAGDVTAATEVRRAALADWEDLLNRQLRRDPLAEAQLERGKLLYLTGDRDGALESFRQAIDTAPDVGSNYADVIAFLVPRGELDEALDAYHRALGRTEVTHYLKVYCSLWIVDLARRAGKPEDPLAAAYLRSTDGGKWYDDLARWATGRASEATLVAHADTPARRAEASFYRAMRAYGDGDVARAKALWKEVLATDMMAFFEFDMAAHYLRTGGAPAKPVMESKPRAPAAPARPAAKKPPDGSI
jgi:tetratricopeptide (TPR) repeat protein